MVTTTITTWETCPHTGEESGVIHSIYKLPLQRQVSLQPSGKAPSMRTTPDPDTISTREAHSLPLNSEGQVRLLSRGTFYIPSLDVSFPSEDSYRLETRGIYRPLGHPIDVTDAYTTALAFHRALHQFRPLSEAYPDLPFEVAFNWEELVLPEEIESEWYAVVSYSKRKDGSLEGRKLYALFTACYQLIKPSIIALYEIDEKAHTEAIRSGGV